MDTLYNESLKNRYLSTKTSRQAYERELLRTSKYEKDLGKDLHSFSMEELENIFLDYKYYSPNTVLTYVRYLSDYLNWCCEKGYSIANPLQSLESDDFNKYVVNRVKYFSKKEFEKWKKTLKSYEDIAVAELLFHGVKGKKYSEIYNLKLSDIDEKEKTIRLENVLNTGRKSLERHLKVEELTIQILKKAFRKVANTEQNKNETLVRHKIVPLGFDKVKPKFIRQSGMVFYGKELINDGELTKSDLVILAERFRESVHNIKGIVTMEQIRETYSDLDKSRHLVIPYSDFEDNLSDINTFSSKNQIVNEVVISRFVRDSSISMDLKELYGNCCMVCGFTIKTPFGNKSEAHHIQPYNKYHKGNDCWANMIVLCPNCHSHFDYIYYAIEPKTQTLHCIDEEDIYHGKKIERHPKHDFDFAYLEYAWLKFQEVKSDRLH